MKRTKMNNITQEDIFNYSKAVDEFNIMIKKQKQNKKTLCENFVYEWIHVINYLNRKDNLK